jgi:hypothetical protein
MAALLRALTKLPPYAGVSYRGFDADATFGTRPGEARVTTGLTATSRGIRIATENSTTSGLFVIAGMTGRALANYSRFPAEHEVVFLPSTLFRVAGSAHLGTLPVVIVEQLDPARPPAEQAEDREAEPWQEWLRTAAEAHTAALELPQVEVTSPGKFVGDIV